MSDVGDLDAIETASPNPKMLIVAKAKRKGLRASVTRELKAAADNFSPVSNDNRLAAEAHVAKLKMLTAQLTEAQNHVLIHADLSDKEIEDEVNRHLDYENKLSDEIYRLEAQIREVQQLQQRSVTNNTTSQSQFDTKSKVTTPKLELTKFSGDPLHWEEFWDDFSCSVDQRTDLSTIDKFKLLKQSLEGDALSLADGYFLTQRNYQEVKDALADRFGDPQVAVFAHFEALLALPPASHEVEQLIRIRDKCEAHIRSLAALGLSEDTFGLVFAPIILSKLPKFVKMEMHRRNGSQAWTLGALREHLKEEIRVRTKSDKSFGSTSDGGLSSTAGTKPGKGQRRAPHTSSSLITQGGKKGKWGTIQKPPTKPAKALKCIFCAGEHHNGDCTKYPTTESRLPLVQGRCYVCFGDKHHKRDCKSTKKCYHCKQSGHNSSLCFEKFGKPPNFDTINLVQGLNPEAPEFIPASSLTVQSDHSGGKSQGRSGMAILESAVVQVTGLKGSAKARLVFDNASSLSFMRSGFSKSIGAKRIGQDRTLLGRFGDSGRDEKRYTMVQVRLRLRDGSDLQLCLREVPAVSAPIRLVPIPFDRLTPMISLDELAEVVTQPAEEEIDILLGLDHYYEIVGPEVSRFSNGIVLKQSSIGKIVTGYLKADCGSAEVTSVGHQMLIIASSSRESELTNLERFWRMEEIGVLDRTDRSDDEIAVQQFNDGVKFHNGRYQVRWPFKSDPPELPVNYEVAFRRLPSVYRKLAQSPDLLKTYHDIFADQLSKGVIEVAPEQPDGPVHYLPHHAVVIPTRETTKVRVVFDASSKPSDRFQSLNEAMRRGPVFLNNLCGLLLRFRIPSFAVTSDVEKAFLQIELQDDHRDCTRFIWLRDPLKPPSPDNIVVYRYARVLFGATASPFLLGATIIHHMKITDTNVSRQIMESTYMDNIIGGQETTDDLLNYYHEAKQLFADMSMNLHQWYSNNFEFMRLIPDTEVGKRDNPSVLGLKWDLSNDTIQCTAGTTSVTKATKRQILKCVASVYDPCGWYSAVTVTGKILLQDIWKANVGWDDEIPDNLRPQWNSSSASLAEIPAHSIPRHLSWDPRCLNSGKFELHVFCDASAKAYAAAVYLRVVDGFKIYTDLLFAKSRVAPVKTLTIPKLELTAAKIGSMLVGFVEQHLHVPISEKVLWSDSLCVLSWIENQKVSTPYVVNRVRDIQQVANLKYRYVPSEDNPADLGSRGVSLSSLDGEEKWWKGPLWLRCTTEEWPQRPDCIPKMPPPEKLDVQMVAQTVKIEPDPIFNIERYSSLSKLLRVTCWVRRAYLKFRKSQCSSGHLTVQEIRESMQFWEHRIQNQHFPDIIMNKLTNQNKLMSNQLGLYADADGYIRCRGRYQDANGLSEDSKYPILLPKDSWFTKLIIRKCHEEILHFGPKHTLARLRERYWVCQGRSVVKSVLLRCQVCRKVSGGPFQAPKPGSLPDFRSSVKRTFTCAGLDYLGPLYVREGDSTKKVWIALFTCAVSRAVHLEVVNSLTAADFLMCLRRFSALFGKPELIVSDNARQFKAADQLLKREFKRLSEDDAMVEQLPSMGITWKYITEKAPWMGGFYERLVATVKEALKKTLGSWTVTIFELQTVCYEAAYVINSRPLVYAEDDPADKVLTPLDLMFRSTACFADYSGESVFNDHITKADELVAHWRAGQNILRQLWDNWQSMYLLSLREHDHSRRPKGGSHIPIAEGAVVLMKESNLPRGQWKIGRISKLRKSHDGVVRSAEVKLSSGSSLLRPVQLLYPIEGELYNPGENHPTPNVSQNDDESSAQSGLTSQTQALTRPIRAAAHRARKLTKQMLARS